MPVVVGGTGLYLRALTDGVVESSRETWRSESGSRQSWLYTGRSSCGTGLNRLTRLEAAKIHPNNRVRVIRALEIFELTGKNKSEMTASGGGTESPAMALNTIVSRHPGRSCMITINRRVDMMFAVGLVAEFECLVNRGYLEHIRRANIIGYNELIQWKEGRLTLEQAVAEIKQNSRRYAKRQMTWFRGQRVARCTKLLRNLRQNLRIAAVKVGMAVKKLDRV